MNGPAVATRLREQASDPLGAALALTLGGLGGLAQWLHDGGAAASWWTALATCLATYAVRLILATSGWELARPVRSHP